MDTSVFVLLGTYTVTSSTAAFATFAASVVPTGVPFYLQGVSIMPTRNGEMTVVTSATF